MRNDDWKREAARAVFEVFEKVTEGRDECDKGDVFDILEEIFCQVMGIEQECGEEEK
jgi:hypothetical protein